MAENSKIGWTDHTFNPWIGCEKIDPGCKNCYAADLDKRYGNDRWGPRAARTRTAPANWAKVRAWDRKAKASGERQRVFVASLADVFDLHPSIMPEWRRDMWALIRECDALDFLLVTKRPENAPECLPDDWGPAGYPNVWLIVTVADVAGLWRIGQIRQVPAAVYGVSYEPAIGGVDFERPLPHACGPECSERRSRPPWAVQEVDWIIVGGESGPRARPFDLAWAWRTVDACKRAGVAVFVKQLGSRPVLRGQPYPSTGKGEDMAEWPEALRVREWPRGRDMGEAAGRVDL